MRDTSTIKALLRKRHPPAEWALAFEVSNGTGANARRHADAVAMNLWPSRGLGVHGFEIKISRGDWQRELQQPEKAEEVARYCDFWWIVTPEGIVRDGELPDAWGLMEVRGNALAVAKAAPKKEAVPVTRAFMAALFRRLYQVDHAEVEQLAQRRAEVMDQGRQASFERRVREASRQHETLRKRLDDFKAASGIDLEDWKHQPEGFGEAVRFVMDSGIVGAYDSIEHIHRILLRASNGLGQALERHRAGSPDTNLPLRGDERSAMPPAAANAGGLSGGRECGGMG